MKRRGSMGALDFIRSEIAAGRPFPTAGQIADELGWLNSSSGTDVLQRLRANGHLKIVRREPSGRSFRYTYALADRETA